MSIMAVKPPTSIVEQIDILRGRGLHIPSDEDAARILSQVSYYRLSAYMTFLRLPNSHAFEPGVALTDLIELYAFDKAFRNSVMSVLESIEITFKNQVATVLSHHYGALGYKEPNNFERVDWHAGVMTQLEQDIAYSRETFVVHHKLRYGDFPVWVAMELLPFGALSKLYGAMIEEDRRSVAGYYGSIPSKYIGSWLHSLATFRNICAHYKRIYALELTIKPTIHSSDMVSNRKVFAVLYIMGKLARNRVEWDSFVTGLAALLERYDIVSFDHLGLPANWEDKLRAVNLGVRLARQ